MSAFANCGRAVAHVRGSYVPEALIQDRLNFQRLRSRKVSLEGHQRHLGGRSALRCSRNRQDVLDLLRCFRTLSIGQLVEQLAL